MYFSRAELIRLYFFLKRELQQGKRWMTYNQVPVFKAIKDLKTFQTRKQAAEYAAEGRNLMNVFGILKIRPLKSLSGAILSQKSVPLIIDTNNYVLLLNHNIMNLKNLEYLQDNLKYLGFPDTLNESLEQNLKAQKPEFQLHVAIPHYSNTADYTLHFRKSDQSDLYFLNKVDASITGDIKISHANVNGIDSIELENRMRNMRNPDSAGADRPGANLSESEQKSKIREDLSALSTSTQGKDLADRLAAVYMKQADFSDNPKLWDGAQKLIDREKVSQTFYLNNGKGVTAKEAYNLLEGRAVNKDLINKSGEKYNAWIQLDFAHKNPDESFKVKQFHSNYGFDLEKELIKYPFKELKDPGQKDDLIKSLKKGNLHLVNVDAEDGNRRQYVKASPEQRTIERYYSNGKLIEPVSLTSTQVESKSKTQKLGKVNEQDEEMQLVKKKGKKLSQ
jgi:hypothetical protein